MDDEPNDAAPLSGMEQEAQDDAPPSAPTRSTALWPQRVLGQGIPVLAWLPRYAWRLDFVDDFLAALTTTAVVIPQAMAYAMLAGLPPQFGLYNAVLPSLLYGSLGTSRHLQVGCFALISLLLNKVVSQVIASNYGKVFPVSNDEDEAGQIIPASLTLGVTLTVSFIAGVTMLLASLLRLSSFVHNHLLPDPLISGFTTAAALHIGTAQLKGLLGLGIPTIYGFFGLARSWNLLIRNLRSTHVPTLAFGLACLALMVVLQWLNRRWNLGGGNSRMEAAPPKYLTSAPPTPTESESPPSIMEMQESPQLSMRSSPRLSSLRSHSPTQREDAVLFVTNSKSMASSRSASPTRPLLGGSPKSFQISIVTTPLPESPRRRLFPRDSRRRTCSLPIPDVLLVVLLSTMVVFLARWDRPESQGGLGLKIIGRIPAGFPSPMIPWTSEMLCPPSTSTTIPFSCSVPDLLLQMILPSISIAVVTFVMSSAIVKLYAKKLHYETEVRPDQDIFALAVATIGGVLLGQSYLPCGSLSRTAVNVSAGGKTPMSGILGAFMVALVLLVATGLLTYVPVTSLSAVVLMAVRGLVYQLRDGYLLLQRGFREGRVQKWDAFLWWWTFVMVAVVDVDVGLACGVLISAGAFILDHVQTWRRRSLEGGSYGYLDPVALDGS